MRKPRALRRGDRIAVVAPASPFARDEFDAGTAELRTLGFEPVYDDSVFDRAGYVAGAPAVRAEAFTHAWNDPSIAALVTARGGYGSVQILPLLTSADVAGPPKAFVGYSDNTSILTWLALRGIVSFHGPMIEGRFARGETGYDRRSFLRCLCEPEPLGEIVDDRIEALNKGEAAGMLVGGTLTQLVASLGTPYAFDPPAGAILFLDEIGERPFRIDRMLTQLRLSGVMARIAAIAFNECPKCDEPGGNVSARGVIADLVRDFPGPVLFGVPSGHTAGATITLPFGVAARVIAGSQPRLVIEEAAVE